MGSSFIDGNVGEWTLAHDGVSRRSRTRNGSTLPVPAHGAGFFSQCSLRAPTTSNQAPVTE
jgi:hypothetical protein